MEIREMTTDALIERRSAIVSELDAEGADLDALEIEARAINAELEERKNAEARKATIREQAAAGGKVVKTFEMREEKKMDLAEIRKSEEYAKAYATYVRGGMKDDAECRALLSTNAPTGGYVPVPTYLENEIKTAWEENQLMNLVKHSNFKGNVRIGFEVSATGATVHVEGSEAPTEEVVTLGTVELKAEMVKKWITVSDEAIKGTTVDTMGYLFKEIAHKMLKKQKQS